MRHMQSVLTHLFAAVPVSDLDASIDWYTRRTVQAGVLEELLISHVPVLFGAGRRLFGVLTSRIELEAVRVIDTQKANHLRYRMRRLTNERTP